MKNPKKRGGTKIGEGEFGCVLYPALVSPPDEAPKYVTKIFNDINIKDYKNELDIYENKIPLIPNYTEFIIHLATPEIQPLHQLNQDQITDIKTCHGIKGSDANRYLLNRSLVFNYVGQSLDKLQIKNKEELEKVLNALEVLKTHIRTMNSARYWHLSLIHI
jgi:hypothetical protein